MIIEPITSDMGGDAIDSTSDMLDKIKCLNDSGMLENLIKKDTADVSPEVIITDPDPSISDPSTVAYVSKRIDNMRTAVMKDTNLPDIKTRLIATGLLDRIEGRNPIRLPGQVGSKTPDKMDKNPAIGPDNVSVSSDGTKIQGKGFVIVGSDVEKLYPSLRPLEGARLTRMAVIESNIDIIDIDHRKALRYLYVAGGMEFLERSGLTNWAPK